MKQALLIVDMINDFVADDGALKVEGAKEFVPIIKRLMECFECVVFVNDAHKESDTELIYSHWRLG